MASVSSLLTQLTGAGFHYEKNSRSATYNFNQDAQSLYRNQPRFPFEYYIDIKLNKAAAPYGAAAYVSKFFNTPEWTQVQPLVKTVEMPSFKIETTPLNQYNRKRLSQTKIDFEPVKMVFHDVADGKTLKFWEMYYRYYFGDGTEPGKNDVKQTAQQNGTGTYTVESFLKNITPSFNPNITGLPASITNLFNGNISSNNNSATNTAGNKSDIQNIISNTLDNHIFGFNLAQVANVRNLIQQIDIYEVHAGRFNQVTLVNPRISAFTHDTLNYSESGKTLELTFTFEYEYAYYTIQNLKLGGTESNNNSTIEPFSHAQNLELPALAFNATLTDFIQSNNPLLQSDNPILQQIGKNVQSSIGSVTGALASNTARGVSSSVLNGLSSLNPLPLNNPLPAIISTRPFASVAAVSPSSLYSDVSRIAGDLFG